jgi:Ca-activated chloride channel family protein
MFKVWRWFICSLFIIVIFTTAAAGYEAAKEELTLSPYFFIEDGDPSVDRFPLKETNVVVNIIGVIAEVHITQKYSNEGRRPINARYIFPASTRAAVHGMKMIIGEQVITAEIKERKNAQAEFDQAKKAGKNTSLLKQQRPNVFSMSVANIMPGDTIDMVLHYTELLVPTDGTYEFVYPTVVGPRYSNQLEAEASETDQWIKSPYLPEGHKPHTAFNIGVKISTGIALQEIACTSHEIDIDWESDSAATIALTDPETFSGDRDYILKFRLAGKEIESGLLLFEDEDENFFLLMVQSPERVEPEDIPPREYIFVIDVSGSMNGFPLNTSKKLLKDLIGNLKESDTFNVILFAGGSRVMASSSVPATTKNIRDAIRFIEKQRGGGGTELLAALRKGFSLPRDESFSRTIAVVTDGYIGTEGDVFNEIQKNLQNTNIFAFGIGSSVNRYLIEGMAKAGLGEPFVVTKPSEAPGAAQKFREYIQSPVLTDIAVRYNGFNTYDIEPAGIPDLFANRPVIVYGKWRGAAEGTIELTGTAGSGEYAQTFYVAETRPQDTNRALRYLWARLRIARLSDFNFKRGNPEHQAEILSLGLTYNLLTAYTSFIAVSDIVRNPEGHGGEPVEDVDQPLPLPLHVSNLAVGGGVSTVPEPELFLLLIMVVFMVSVIFFYRKFKFRTPFSR